MSASTNHRDDGCGPYDEGRHLRIWLGHNDAPCPVCGYNLRHLSGNICPECGQQFKLRVGDVDLRFGLLLAFIAPMTMLCGLSLVLWGVVIATLTSGPGPWRIGVMMLGGVVAGFATMRSYYRRRWFLDKPNVTQRVLVGLSWLVCTLIVVFCIKMLPI